MDTSNEAAGRGVSESPNQGVHEGGAPKGASPEDRLPFDIGRTMIEHKYGAHLPPKDSNPKTVYGAAKPALSLLPGPALIEIAEAMREGKAKYGSMNWRADPVSSTTYADALLRHAFQWVDGEDRCPQSGSYHLAHLAANAMILLDAMLQGTLIDDRPPRGTTSEAIARNTRDIPGIPFESPGFQGGSVHFQSTTASERR